MCCSTFQESGKKLGDKFENFGDKLKKVGECSFCTLVQYHYYMYVCLIGTLNMPEFVLND